MALGTAAGQCQRDAALQRAACALPLDRRVEPITISRDGRIVWLWPRTDGKES